MKYKLTDTIIIDFENINKAALNCLNLFRQLPDRDKGLILGRMDGILYKRMRIDSEYISKTLNDRSK